MSRLSILLISLLLVVCLFAVTTDYYMAASGDDGYAAKFDSVWPPTEYPEGGSTPFKAEATWNGSFYLRAQGLVRFDTSAIPDDATVSDATLYYYPQSVGSADSGTLYFGWSSVTWPIDSADYSSGTDGTGGSTLLSAVVNGAWNQKSLTTPTNVNLIGWTQLRLTVGISGTPTGGNLVQLMEYGSGYPAYLKVTYTAPATGKTHIIVVGGG